jgi:putrescine aminotransferase
MLELRHRDTTAGTPPGREGVLESYRRHLNSGYARLAEYMALPVEVRSEGALVFDERGETYLDCGGYGVFILGHRHPHVVEAVRAQLDRHPLSTRVLLSAELAQAATALAEIAPEGLQYVLFTNSGAEATEAGLKIARLNGKRHFVSTHGGFHGKTFGALSVTGRPRFQDPFQPLLTETTFVPYGRADALEETLATLDRGQAAVIVEPVQGEGGVIVPPQGYLRAVRGICDRYDALLILDEIQTGLGRLGAWWGADREGIVPDVLLVGKGLSGGVVPVAAAVCTAGSFEPLNRDPLLHTSTFAGNPLAMAAARAAIEAIGSDGLIERADALGRRLLDQVREIIRTTCPAAVRDVRGAGLLIGIEFAADDLAGEFMLELMHRRVVVSHSLNSHRVVRLTPPAILDDSQEAWLLEALLHAATAVAGAAR